ncbi:hypothetical protein SRB17_30010 [Streptomyces sp. RB17]|uniref:cupin domain-containing protein n=1 Tax=Streptomyces sp. RB17 TaxID=2585197 RepID=UPI001296A726|nr:cupin domain-containing protein [Streptomyces sp. RB17]MQY35029.1 hypothetical protein [Streptomyces sp. RB17]
MESVAQVPQVFETTALSAAQDRSAKRYLEFLRVPALSAGLYVLPADGTDPQLPHHEDELYVVLTGRARLRVGATDHAVAPGSVCYVPAEAAHRFHSITEELRVLVVFAPAETPYS